VTVRVLFERMIDQARATEAGGETGETPPEAASPSGRDPMLGGPARTTEAPSAAAGVSLCDELAALPGRVVRGVLFVPGAVLRLAGGCRRRQGARAG
jgi:hypothetical protein